MSVPVYRVTRRHGGQQQAEAARVVLDQDEVRLQVSDRGVWRTAQAIGLDELRSVERRFNEADGRVRWVVEPDVATALAARAAPTVEAPRVPVPAGQTATVPAASPRAVPRDPVRPQDVRCSACGEGDDLTGERKDGDIVLTCGACGHVGPRAAARTCPSCAGTDVVMRPRALVERARGSQLVLLGYTEVGLCRQCDHDELVYSLEHNTAVLPPELPTVDPDTLQALRQGHRE